jgi:hypothetical protein
MYRIGPKISFISIELQPIAHKFMNEKILQLLFYDHNLSEILERLNLFF